MKIEMKISAELVRRMRERYRPCRNGIHVCGADEAAYEFFTVANFPRLNEDQARTSFWWAKHEFQAAEGEPTDLVVDLMIGGDIAEDFCMTRQMLDRMTRGLEAGNAQSACG
jgi:hypothetical protein